MPRSEAVPDDGTHVSAAVDRVFWDGAWTGLRAEPPPAREYETLLAAYSEPHRAYHTLQHLEECLANAHQVRMMCEHPDEVTLALWYHDAIYRPVRSDNEARSAEWLVRVARNAGVAKPCIDRLHSLVLATRHDADAGDADARWVVDIDLSILGAPAARFDEYEQQVRREYRWAPGPLYRKSRAKVIESFLRRSRIYSTDYFADRLENVARSNLARSLAQLRR